MKNKLLYMLGTILVIAILIFSIDPVTDKLAELFRDDPTIVISTPNHYYKAASYKYVKENKKFIPYSKQDLKDIFYSILNNGYDTFTFYCPSEYPDCIKDVGLISKDDNTLTHINNFVSPFNNFKTFNVIYSETGEVTIEVEKLYTNKEITAINNVIDNIIFSAITEEMDAEEKILTIHDYIINKTKYDTNKIDGNSTYNSSTAYGPLLEGYAICGGYADAMALFLNRFNIPNYKIASSEHVWNAVYLNNTWFHLDLTWDDPVDEKEPSKESLLHKFYLITTLTLEGYKIDYHDYDHTIYQELAT